MIAPEDLTYPGAPDTLIALWQKRRGAMGFAPGEALAPLDCDLARLAATHLTPAPVNGAGEKSAHASKEQELRLDLGSKSELALLNALVTAHLRKRRFPAHAPALFQRIWQEQGGQLCDELSTRWLISSAITFGEHGVTEDQRSLGRELGMMFSLMKLYEFERLFSGFAPNQAFDLGKRSTAKLPLDMPGFSLASGGLDINLLAPLWQRANAVPVLGPLACVLLERINGDPGTLFRRISVMRKKKRARQAARS